MVADIRSTSTHSHPKPEAATEARTNVGPLRLPPELDAVSLARCACRVHWHAGGDGGARTLQAHVFRCHSERSVIADLLAYLAFVYAPAFARSVPP